MVNRRQSLIGMAALFATPYALAWPSQNQTVAAKGIVACGWHDGGGRYELWLFCEQGQIKRVPCGIELHQILRLGGERDGLLGIGRKPSEHAFYLPTVENLQGRLIGAPPASSFLGHGAVDERYGHIYLCGHDHEDEQGRLFVYSVDGLQYQKSLNSSGTEPHQLLNHPVLGWLLAHGGDGVDPYLLRYRVPQAAQRSCLSQSPPNSGGSADLSFQNRWDTEDTELSLRHLCMAPDGAVFIGARTAKQAKTDQAVMYQLCNGELTSLPHKKRLRYALSLDANLEWVVATFPWDNCVVFWRRVKKDRAVWQQTFAVESPSGLVLAGSTVLLVTRAGQFITLAFRDEAWQPVKTVTTGGVFSDHILYI